MGKVRNKKCSKVARCDPTGLEKTVEAEDEVVCADLGPVSAFVSTILEQVVEAISKKLCAFW